MVVLSPKRRHGLCREQKTVPEKMDGFFDEILQLRFAHGTGDLVDNFAPLEQNEGRDGPYAEFSWCGRDCRPHSSW
jgi:hypothetical protein